MTETLTTLLRNEKLQDLHPPALIEVSDNQVRVRSFIYLLIYRFICLFISTLRGRKLSAALLPNSIECSLSLPPSLYQLNTQHLQVI